MDIRNETGRDETARDDPEFRWLERGAGEPIVLLHGLMGQMHHWDAVLEALDDGYRPIALTLPIFHHDLREASVAWRATCSGSWTRWTFIAR